MVLMGKDCLSSALTMEQGSCSYSLQAADSSKVTEQLNDSLYQLHKPRGRPSLQVVFFHGFQLGGYENAHLSAWTCEDGSRVWPQTWLVEKYPEAHILSVSYSLGLMKSAKGGSVDMYIMGENLLKDLLQQDTGQERHCPMVLVGHSFGGLVIKQLCLQAHKRRSTWIFLENLKGVFFYGTPHHGIPFKNAVSLFMNQDPLLEYVKLLSTPTSRLNYEFENLRTEFTYTWRVAGVGENLPTELGRFKRSVVVPEASARYGDFSVVNADHITICRPSTEISTGFQSLISLLRQIHDPSQVRSGSLILKETLNLKTAEFITKIKNGRDSGHFVRKAWMLSLKEHEYQALTSVLRQNGYVETCQTDTTVFYEKINEAVQVSNSCNENIDLGVEDTNKVVASSDYEHKIRDIEKHIHHFHLASQLKRSDFVDPEVSTSSFQNKMQSVPVQNDQTAFVDSSKSLLDKGKMPLATSNERLESFKRAINDTSLGNYSVSTQWISTLSDQERENLNFALSKAGYLQIDRTNRTTYFERLQGHVRNNPNHESESSSTLQSTGLSEVRKGLEHLWEVLLQMTGSAPRLTTKVPLL